MSQIFKDSMARMPFICMMVKLEGIRKSYFTGEHSLEVLKGIDLHIKEGEMVSIMGSSGSGKSTLLNILGLLDFHDLLNGQAMKDLTETKAAKLRNELIGFVFQSFNLVNFKTAQENVALPLYYRGIGRKKRNLTAMELLDKLGLKDWANHLPSELSGGQKQRVAIARALISDPKLILADEPTGALDTTTSYEVMDLLKQVHDQGKTVMIVTHEKDIAAMTQRTIMLKDGKIV
jgi:putative ABC transport system ATP-binding protein